MMKCQNDGNPYEYLLVNREEEQRVCSVCLKDELFNFVTSNDQIAFRYDRAPVGHQGIKGAVYLE